MNYDKNNIFAKILRGEMPSTVVAENEHAISIANAFPKSDVHDLVLPKGLYADYETFIYNAKEEEFRDFFALMTKTAKKRGLLLDISQVLINNGVNGGQTVPHLHAHIFSDSPLIQAVEVDEGRHNDILSLGEDNFAFVVTGELEDNIPVSDKVVHTYFDNQMSFWQYADIISQKTLQIALSGWERTQRDFQMSTAVHVGHNGRPNIKFTQGKKIHLRSDLAVKIG